MEQERALKERRHNVRLRHIRDTYKECGQSVGFAHKNHYIEDRIELTQKYFGYLNDFDHSNTGVNINKIRKELFRFQRDMRSKQKQQKTADPLEILKNLTPTQTEFSPLPVPGTPMSSSPMHLLGTANSDISPERRVTSKAMAENG